MKAMLMSAGKLAESMQGFKVAYIQSDEASFLITDYDRIESQGWFDYNINKMVSISASTMSIWFNKFFVDARDTKNPPIFDSISIWFNKLFVDAGNPKNPPIFDSRAFNVPDEDIANYFLWRSLDWKRNSLLAYTQSFFSHKQMQGKKQEDMHEMLHSIEKNWTTDLKDVEKNGTFLVNDPILGIIIRQNILPTYEEISQLFQ